MDLVTIPFMVFALAVVIFLMYMFTTIFTIFSSGWGLFFMIFVFTISLIRYIHFYGTPHIFSSLITNLHDSLDTNKPPLEIDIDIKHAKPVENTSEEEVFNIPNGVHTLNDAGAVCKAYNSRLATLPELESAHSKGADWCALSWTDGQIGAYPTQQSTFDELQKTPAKAHMCGLPQVNASYISDPKMKLGVNCFGKKPVMSEIDQLMMRTSATPRTKEEEDLEKRVTYWKNRLDTVIVAPFDKEKWSELEKINN